MKSKTLWIGLGVLGAAALGVIIIAEIRSLQTGGSLGQNIKILLSGGPQATNKT